VTRLSDGAVDRGENVAARRRADDLEDDRARHFLWCHVLHLPREGYGLKFADGEETVLAGVGADDFQRHVAPFESFVLRLIAQLQLRAERLLMRLDEVRLPALAADPDVPFLHAPEADHRARLHFLH